MTPLVSWLAAAMVGAVAVPLLTGLGPVTEPSTLSSRASQRAWMPQPVRRISLAKGAVASSGDPAAVLGAILSPWEPASATGEWLAIPLSEAASRTLLVGWNAAGYGYLQRRGGPKSCAYSSADSTDGRDGTWTRARHVANNAVRARIDTVTAPGARWLKLGVEAGASISAFVSPMAFNRASCRANSSGRFNLSGKRLGIGRGTDAA